MKPETIAEGIDYLALATATEITDERMTVYIAQLSDLKNQELFAETIKQLANTHQYMPKIADIRTTYRELLLRYVPNNALAAGPDHGWQHVADCYDDCLGDCGRKRPLGELMRNNGFCLRCHNKDERITAEDSRIRRWFKAALTDTVRDMP